MAAMAAWLTFEHAQDVVLAQDEMLLAVNFSEHLQGADSSNSTAFREIAAACEAGWPRRISASSALHLAHNRAETLESSRPLGALPFHLAPAQRGSCSPRRLTEFGRRPGLPSADFCTALSCG
jgi:hypothetical protein